MKFRKLSLLLSIIMIVVSLQVPAIAATEAVTVEPSYKHGNTVKATAFTAKERKVYSSNGNIRWTGYDFDTDYKKGTISVNDVVKNGLQAYETVKYYDSTGVEQDKYSAVGYRVSYTGTDPETNYTTILDNAGVHEFGFEVTYFDSSEMAGNWLLVYKTWQTGNNQYGHYGMPLVQYEGTNTWKRHRWTHDYGSDLSKWSFWSDQEERVDFKFYNVEGTIGSTTVNKDNATVGAAYIHDFTVLPIDEFNEYCAKTSDNYLTAEFGGVISYGMESNIAGYNKDGGTVGGVDNRYSAKISANQEVTFSAPGTALKGKMGKIVVECYAKEKTNVTLNGITLVHTGDLQPDVSSGSDNSYQKLSFLQSCITDGEYTLTADKDIQISSIHYEGVAVAEKANTVTADLSKVTYDSPQSSADGKLMFVGQTDKNTYMSWYTPAVVSGLPAFKSQERKDDSGNTREDVYSWIPFRVGASYAEELRAAGKDEVGYEVTYFDAAEMEGKFLKVNMDWADEGQETVNRQSAIKYISLTGSNSWKTYRGSWDTYGGWFAPWTTQVSRGNPNFELLVCESDTGAGRDQTTVPAIIHSVTVMSVEDYMNSFATDGDAYISVEKGAVISAGITSSIDGKYQGAGVSQHGDAFGADIAAESALTFTVDSMAGKNDVGTVTVKCYADEDASVTLGADTKTLTGGVWQVISFEDVALGEELSLTADKAISVASVKVKSDISAMVNANNFQELGYSTNVSIKGLTANEGSKLLVAIYAADGRFITVGIADVEAGVESYSIRANTEEVSQANVTAKVFLWDGMTNLVPVCVQTELAVK